VRRAVLFSNVKGSNACGQYAGSRRARREHGWIYKRQR